jgi:hypothetical protein
MHLPRWVASVVLAGLVFLPPAANGDDREAVAFSGAPFGVGMVRIPAKKGETSQPSDVTYHVEAADGRVFYPVFFREETPGNADPGNVSVRGAYFLFKGADPLTVRFSDGRTTTPLEVAVTDDPGAKRKLLDRWWSQYQRTAKAGETVPVVENYTTHMLARRLGLEPPARATGQSWNENELLGAFLGFEEMRLAMQADRMLNDGDRPEPADQPLPMAVLPPPISVPEFADAKIEPLASRVPEECFYVRFGSYGNYRWFRETMNTWGGNLREIVATRSLDYDIAGRMEKQLVLKDSELGKLLGDAAIRDMAVIGSDTFVREGASIGVLFQENQPGLLASAIATQRAAAKQASNLTEQTVDMEGKKITVLTAPGNLVRSYYVADGGYHFITTSSTLARRFVETGKGVRQLASLKEFQYARTKHGIGDGNPILAYLSDPFIRQLVSPAYRVEMTRRMKAEADVELVAIARLAAIGEGAAHGSVDELVDGGYLPAKFGKRADDTIPLIVEGKVVDSLRGSRRTFLPVADVTVAGVTKSEADAYQRFSQAYQALYRRMDPISMRMTREPSGADREKIVLDVSITPFTRQNLGSMANFLPPASKQQIATGPEVVALLDVGVQSRVFAGVVDHEVPYRIENGRVDADPEIHQRPPLFIGEQGRGYRHLLDVKGEKSADGYFSRSASSRPSGSFGLDFGREWGDWWTAAFNEQSLRRVTPKLSMIEGPRTAQVRLTIGNLGESKMAPFLRSQQYIRERETSRANARTLDAFTDQLKVPDNGAVDAASTVLGAGLVCPLGGEYRRDPPDYQFSTHQPWYSTAWAAPKTPWRETPFFERLSMSNVHEPPAGYEPRLLRWFKGLGVEVQFDQQTMFSRMELEVAAKK